MSYATPKIDWDAADYFNLTDWSRVYNNARLTSSLAAIMLEETIQFDTIMVPTISTDPRTGMSLLNTILANIERTRLAMAALTTTLTEVKDDWVAGVSAPYYPHANQWETTVDAIWDHWDGDDLDVDRVLTGDLTILTGTYVIVVDSIDLNGYTIDIQGTGALHIL